MGKVKKGEKQMNRNYVVCECTGVTAGGVEQAVKEGARTLEDVKEKLGVGKQCVKCKDLVSILVDSYVEDLEG